MPKNSFKRRLHKNSRDRESKNSNIVLDYLKKMDNRLKKLENCRGSRSRSPKFKRFRRMLSSSSSASSTPERSLSRESSPVAHPLVSNRSLDSGDVSSQDVYINSAAEAPTGMYYNIYFITNFLSRGSLYKNLWKYFIRALWFLEKSMSTSDFLSRNTYFVPLKIGRQWDLHIFPSQKSRFFLSQKFIIMVLMETWVQEVNEHFRLF